MWSHSWVLDPVLAPGAFVRVGGVLVGEALLLLGEGGLGQEREQPVEVDIKTEAGGDIVWDAAPDLEVHLTILRDPPGQANIEILSS